MEKSLVQHLNHSMQQTQTLPVIGIHCASCASTISKVISKQPGVEKCQVNVATENATVTFDASKTSINSLNDKLKPYGYSLKINSQPDSQHSTLSDHDKVMFVFPLSLLIFTLMMWDILSQLIPQFPPLFLPMQLFNLINFILSSVILFVFGQQFIQGVKVFATTKTASMDTLIGVGSLSAYFYSSFILFFPQAANRFQLAPNTYFDVVIVVIGFILFGKYLESKSKQSTREAIKKLIKLQAKTAIIFRNHKEVEIPIEDVTVGDIFVVKPGAKIPVDGEIISGETSINESMITGEPIPTDKSTGDSVIAGTINLQGNFQAKATKVGENTVLSQIIKMVENAQGSKAPIERLADSISAIFVPTVLIIAALTLISWLVIGSFYIPTSKALAYGISSFVGVLVIACPCALGLATPTAIIVGVGKGAENGILIKDAESLEKLYKTNILVMDKTGTITLGKPEVTDVYSEEIGKSEIIKIAASIEYASEHPLAQAIVSHHGNHPLKKVTHFRNLEGKGVEGVVDGSKYLLSSAKAAQESSISIDENLINTKTKEGKTAVILSSHHKALGYIFISDQIKSEAKDAIEKLHQMKIKVIMLTGDNANTAKFIGNLVGVDEVIAGVLPHEKANIIKKLQNEGKFISMVGDGINDAPALATANVGIAMSTGTDIALESANITLLQGDLSKLAKAIKLSKTTMAVIKQNLFWAFIYNILGIPLAAGIFYPLAGILLNPVFAGLAMAFSSVSVVSNSLKLKTIKL